MQQYFFSFCDIYFRVTSPIPMQFQEDLEKFSYTEQIFFEKIKNDSRLKSFYGEGIPRSEYFEDYVIDTYEGELQELSDCVADAFSFWIYRESDCIIYRYRVGKTINPYHAQLTLNLRTHRHTLLIPAEYLEPVCANMKISGMLGIEPLVLSARRMIMHAACVRMHGEMILFTGPSGMGKSTQSNLWIRHLGADPVDGDKTMLRFDYESSEIEAYGSLYAGTSGINENISAPIRAIVSLQQGPDNRIRRLRMGEAYRKLYPRFLVPQWDSGMTSTAMGLIQELVTQTPVYELSCTPDERAVDLAYETIFKDRVLEEKE